VSTQRTAASASNPFIQRAILFDLKELPISPFFPRCFSHLVVWEIPAPGIEKVFFNPRSQIIPHGSKGKVHDNWRHLVGQLVPQQRHQPTCSADFQVPPAAKFLRSQKKDAKVRLALPSGIPVGV
jgi:hypothetical protein